MTESFRAPDSVARAPPVLLRYHRPVVRTATLLLPLLLLLGCAGGAAAQDPVAVSPALYKVEIDNARVRALRDNPRHAVEIQVELK